MRRLRCIGLVGLLLALGGTAHAQEAPEPLSVVYDAPDGCPTAEAFLGEVSARTTHARAAQADEPSRVMHVAVLRRAEQYRGRLWIDDASRSGTARTISGATCSEVVGALALVAALAVDPRASLAPAAALASAPDAASLRPAAVLESPAATSDSAPAGGNDALPPLGRRFLVGVQAEALFVAGAVGSGRVFGDLSLGDRDALFAPAVRVAIARSLEVEQSAAVGGASLRWTLAALEICPLRLRLLGSLAVRPCAGAAAGVIDTAGIGIAATVRRERPWAALSAVGRLVWEPARALVLEVEAGASAPLVRESFFFTPSTTVYEAAPAAFLSRAGVGVRFP